MWNRARSSSIASATTAALLLLNLAGCGGASDNLPRQAVSGTVFVEGKPLASGLITFQPDGPEVSTQGGGAVVDGKFSIPLEQGLVPGKYKVAVTAAGDIPAKKEDKDINPGMPPIPAKEVIPKEYNSGSLLKAEVTAGGKNMFDFNLTRMKGN